MTKLSIQKVTYSTKYPWVVGLSFCDQCVPLYRSFYPHLIRALWAGVTLWIHDLVYPYRPEKGTLEWLIHTTQH